MPVLKVVGYAVAFAVLTFLGRLTVQPSGYALFWPCAGVAVLWVLRAVRRTDVLVAVATVAVLSFLINLVTGAEVVGAVLLGVANATLATVAWVTGGLMQRVMHARDHYRDPSLPTQHAHDGPVLTRLAGLRDLVVLGVACSAGAVVSALPGGLAGLALSGATSFPLVLGWMVRNGVGAFAVSGPLLCVGIAGPTSWRRRAVRLRVGESVLLVLVTVAVVLWAFGPDQYLPLSFLPMAVVCWAGMRLPPAAASGFGLALGVTLVVLVRVDRGGSFMAVPDEAEQAVVVQAFVGIGVAIALLLSLGVAEREQLADRLRRSREHARHRATELAAVAQAVPEGLMVVDRTGEVVLANPAADLLRRGRVGATEGEPVSAIALLRLDGTPMPLTERPSTRALNGETVRAALAAFVRPETGQRQVWAIDAVPLWRTDDPPHAPSQAIVLFRDVTSQERRLAELEMFAGVVAHDLKNPVGIVRGWAEVLAEQLDDEGVSADSPSRTSLHRIDQGAAKAETLIRDLLDYSTSRSAPLHPTLVELDPLVDELAVEVRATYPTRDVQLTRSTLGSVEADPTLVRQVLANLIGNAAKYVAPQVRPVIRVDADRVGGFVRVRVIDNGIGVPPAERTTVFEPFHRAHLGGGYAGTGLGLAICRQAVQRHGGTVEVIDSPHGAGSCFVVSLPVRRHDHAGEVAAGGAVGGPVPAGDGVVATDLPLTAPADPPAPGTPRVEAGAAG